MGSLLKALTYTLLLISLGSFIGYVLFYVYFKYTLIAGIFVAIYLKYKSQNDAKVQEERDNAMKSLKKKVCVIGAGSSGLVCLKELKVEGHDVYCFEAGSTIGGAFSKPTESASRSYDNLYLTISNFYMAFSDFPPKDEWKFWTRQEYADYLEDYARHFDLFPHISLKHQCKEIVKLPSGQYKVVLSKDGSEIELLFDAVCVAIGSHQIPSIPDFPGLETFEGPVNHSYDFGRQGLDMYRGKRVVTVGSGESASDIVKEVSDVTKECYNIARRYPFCIPRMLPDGHPNDAFTGRLFYPNEDDNFLVWFVVLLIFVFIWFPLSFTRWAYPYQQWRKRDPKDPTTTNAFGKVQRDTRGWLDLDTPRTIEIVRQMCEWHNTENTSWCNKSVNKNLTFVPNIVDGKIKMIRSEIKEVRKNSVILLNGTEIECDVILFCTGYKDRFPFLEESLRPENNDVRTLFYHSFKPEVGSSLCFAGTSRPTSGAIPGCSELVGRYFALLCSGKRTLPLDIKERTLKQMKKENEIFHSSPNIRALVNPFDFFDGMAKLIGCYHSVWNYWNQPLAFFLYKCGLNGLARYRILGPHSKASDSERWLRQITFPLPHPGTGVALIVKLMWCLGFGSGDFVVELRKTGIVEPTLALAMPFNQVATRNLLFEEQEEQKKQASEKNK